MDTASLDGGQMTNYRKVTVESASVTTHTSSIILITYKERIIRMRFSTIFQIFRQKHTPHFQISINMMQKGTLLNIESIRNFTYLFYQC